MHATFYTTIILSICVVVHATSSSATDIDVQKEVTKFYNSLNTEERAQLSKIAKTQAANFSFTDDNFLDGLKGEAAGLVGKLSGLKDLINEKLATMQPESRTFIQEVIRKFFGAFGEDGIINIASAMKGLGHEMITMFDQLSSKTQQDIVSAFPTFASVATSDIARLLLKKIAEFDLGTRSWTPAPTITLDDSDSSSERRRSKPKPHSESEESDEVGRNTTRELKPTSRPHRKEKANKIYPPIDVDEPIQSKKIIKT